MGNQFPVKMFGIITTTLCVCVCHRELKEFIAILLSLFLFIYDNLIIDFYYFLVFFVWCVCSSTYIYIIRHVILHMYEISRKCCCCCVCVDEDEIKYLSNTNIMPNQGIT